MKNSSTTGNQIIILQLDAGSICLTSDIDTHLLHKGLIGKSCTL